MKILVFAPHSAIWVHAFPEALIAESLGKSSHEIVYVTCGGVFSDYCIPMSAQRIRHDAPPAEKLRVCAHCGRNARLLRKEFGFRGYDLASALTKDDGIEIEDVMARVSHENFRTIEFENLQIGRFALYQFLILNKKIGYDFSAEEWNEYLLHLRVTTTAVAGLRHVFEKEKPHRVLLYNGLYSVNMACREMAARHGIASYFLHAGGGLANRLQTLMLGREHTFRFYPALISHWKKYRELAISSEQMRPATDHFIELLRGRSVFAYSPSKSSEVFNIQERFRIEATKKIIVAAMGSYDEEFAAEAVGARLHTQPPLFQTQAEWIRNVIAFVSKRHDLFLIIRVHPRELPNRREQVRSEHSAMLENLLVDLPSNVVVNWPTDGISIYDLAEKTDVFLNSWSSVGKEMSLLGLPVVTYADSITFYPPDLNYTGATVSDYLGQIDRALADGWSAERIRMTYRWLAIEYGLGLVNIADSYSERENERPSLAMRVLRKLRRTIDADATQRRDCARRAPSLRAADTINQLIESGSDTILDVFVPAAIGGADREDESESLRQEIRRLMPHLYRSGDVVNAGTLRDRLSAFVEGA